MEQFKAESLKNISENVMPIIFTTNIQKKKSDLHTSIIKDYIKKMPHSNVVKTEYINYIYIIIQNKNKNTV